MNKKRVSSDKKGSNPALIGGRVSGMKVDLHILGDRLIPLQYIVPLSLVGFQMWAPLKV